MKAGSSKKIAITYTSRGVFIGLAFLLLIYAIEIIVPNIPISLDSVTYIHQQVPALFLADTLPLLLAIIGYLIGKYIESTNNEFNSELVHVQNANKKILTFIEKLREGETKVKYKLEGSDDRVGQSLIKLRDRINANREEEDIRKNEDFQRSWVSEGLAKFGDILRKYNDDIEKLSTNIVSNLVQYIEAKQAGFFVLNEDHDDEKFFELTAMFAYERKKFLSKNVSWGEGLIGTCALERKTIYLTEVPEGYVNITSGLGNANPKSILIVPLLVNDQVHGVIEVASFKEYEPYQIEFVEKVAESIASTLSNMKINLRTGILLKETQKQTGMMTAQEEKMRKGMEELRNIQEDKAEQSQQFVNFTNSVNHTLIRAEYSTNGTLSYANTKFLEKLGYVGNSEVEGKHISMFINEKDRAWFDKIWEDLAAGGRHFEGDMKHVTKQGKEVWTMATYVSVRDTDGMPEKILFLGIDTTEAKKQSLDFEGQINALNISSLKAEFSISGKFLNANQLFLDALEYKEKETSDLSVFHMLSSENLLAFKRIWTGLSDNKHFQGPLQLKTRNEDDIWLFGTFTGVNDMYGEIAKVILIASDITEQKRIEHKAQKQTEQLKNQEKRLQQSQIDLSRKLREAREEMKAQFREIEIVKILNDRTLAGLLDAVVIINQNNIIEFFNKAAEDVWGYTDREVVGKNIDILLPDAYKGNNDDYLGNFFHYGSSALVGKRTEVFIVNKMNEEIGVLVTLSEAKEGDEYTLTAFLQNIEVELF